MIRTKYKKNFFHDENFEEISEFVSETCQDDQFNLDVCSNFSDKLLDFDNFEGSYEKSYKKCEIHNGWTSQSKEFLLSSTFCPTLEDANVDNLLKFESEKGENFLDFIETFDEVKKGVL